MPAAPWMMTQTWHDLLFAHWPSTPPRFATKIPAGLRARSLRTPGVARRGAVSHEPTSRRAASPRCHGCRRFPSSTCARTCASEEMPACISSAWTRRIPSPSASRGRCAPSLLLRGDAGRTRDGWIHYNSRRTSSSGPPAEIGGRYRPTETSQAPMAGTLEHFLTERYCLFTVDTGSSASAGYPSPAVAAAASRGGARREHDGRRGGHPPARHRAAPAFFRRRTWSSGCSDGCSGSRFAAAAWLLALAAGGWRLAADG